MNFGRFFLFSALLHFFLILIFALSFFFPAGKGPDSGDGLIARLVTPEETMHYLPHPYAEPLQKPLPPSVAHIPSPVRPDVNPPIPSLPEVRKDASIKIPAPAVLPFSENREKTLTPKENPQPPVQTKSASNKPETVFLSPPVKNEAGDIKKDEAPSAPQQKKQNAGAHKPAPAIPSIKEKLFDRGIIGDFAKRDSEKRDKEKKDNIPLLDTKKDPTFKPRDLLKDKDGRTFDTDKGLSFDVSELKFMLYNMKLKERIEHIWIYPPGAAARGISGDLIISFTIRKNGKLGSVELVRTSGYKDLDDAAMKALKDAAPFWPLPESWGMDSYTITGHFVYTIIYNL